MSCICRLCPSGDEQCSTCCRALHDAVRQYLAYTQQIMLAAPAEQHTADCSVIPHPRTDPVQGKRFDEIPYYFPDGSVFGLVNNAAQRCLLNPPADTRVQKGDALIMMRPTSIASEAYRPLPRPIAVTPGEVVPAAAANCQFPAAQPHCGQLRCSGTPKLPALGSPRHT